MVANARKKWTVEDYLAFERASEEKHEYADGDVFPVGQPPLSSTRGAGRRHSLILANTLSSLNHQLRDCSCEVYSLDMGISISSGKGVTADVTVVCGEPRFADGEFDTLLNPTLIVEVLSDSTEDYDRGKKFKNYRLIESLQEYILIAHHETRIDYYIRQTENTWLLSCITTLESTLQLPAIGCTLNLADVYRKITFPT